MGAWEISTSFSGGPLSRLTISPRRPASSSCSRPAPTWRRQLLRHEASVSDLLVLSHRRGRVSYCTASPCFLTNWSGGPPSSTWPRHRPTRSKPLSHGRQCYHNHRRFQRRDTGSLESRAVEYWRQVEKRLTQQQTRVSIFSSRDSSEIRVFQPNSTIQHRDVAGMADILESHRHDPEDLRVHEDDGHQMGTPRTSLSLSPHAVGSPYEQRCSPPRSGHDRNGLITTSIPDAPVKLPKAVNDAISAYHRGHDARLKNRANIPGFLRSAYDELWPVVRDADGSTRILTEEDGVESWLGPDRSVDGPFTQDPPAADSHVHRGGGDIENIENQPGMPLPVTWPPFPFLWPEEPSVSALTAAARDSSPSHTYSPSAGPSATNAPQPDGIT